MTPKFRTLELSGVTAVEIEDGIFKGVVFMFGKVKPIEIAGHDELKLEFEYQVILDEFKHVEGSSRFTDTAFNILMEIIEKSETQLDTIPHT